jgi:hypothetical protein
MNAEGRALGEAEPQLEGEYDQPNHRLTFDFGDLDVDTCLFEPCWSAIVECFVDVEISPAATSQLCNQAVITFPTAADPVTPTNVTTHFSRPREDLDADCDVDIDDVRTLLRFRNQPAASCSQFDLDGDGTITVLDARRAVLACDRARCVRP